MIRLDLIRQTVSGTPGTGNITLSTAVTGYIGIADHPDTTDGMLVEYCIVDGNNKEFGIGTYTATGTVLARTWVQGKLDTGVYSKNPGTGLSLTSAAIVSCGPVATNLNFSGVLLKNSSSQSVDTVTYTPMIWDSEVFDTLGFHDTVTNNQRITIPSGKGIRRVSLKACLTFSANSTGDRAVRFQKNGTDFDGQGFQRAKAGAASTRLALASSEIDVIDNDYFTVDAHQDSGSTLSCGGAGFGSIHWFSLRVIE